MIFMTPEEAKAWRKLGAPVPEPKPVTDEERAAIQAVKKRTYTPDWPADKRGK